jgi:hypothetical protein
VHRMYHGTGATNTSLRLVKYVRRKSRRAPFTLAGMTLLAIQAFMLAALAQNEAWRKDSNDNNRYQVSNEGTFIKDGRRAEPGGAGLFQHKDSMVGSGKSEGRSTVAGREVSNKVEQGRASSGHHHGASRIEWTRPDGGSLMRSCSPG